MIAVIGKYVMTFAEATHALPDGMHMNADYPFMLPPITARGDGTITISGRRGLTATVKIKRNPTTGREFAVLTQSSSFETMFNRKPKKFVLQPFRSDGGPT